MCKNRQLIIDKCRALRLQGCSLGEISSILKLPKTTVYGYVEDVVLTNKQKQNIEEKRKLLATSRPNPRKGKCIHGRYVHKPVSWSGEMVHIIAHFMFDGRVEESGCLYYSKNKSQIVHLRDLMHKVFKVKPRCSIRRDGVRVLSFYYVELAAYVKRKKEEIHSYLKNGAPKNFKRIFLQAFFDDEGNVYFTRDKRRVRGYQKSLSMLQEIRKLLKEFGIEGRINKNSDNIEITGKANLMRFYDEINFSPKIYINPHRKNGIWKRKIEKKRILELAIKSYRGL